MSLTLSDIQHLLENRGQSQYGMEAVNQREHALQCAHLAEQAGETPETIVASLLHDLGHLLAAERDGVQEWDTETDDLHQFIALPFLRARFPDAVLEPIRLHVDAKRYLCLIDPDYWAVAFLRRPQTKDLAKTGDASKKLIVSEGTLVCRNPNASSKVVGCA